MGVAYYLVIQYKLIYQFEESYLQIVFGEVHGTVITYFSCKTMTLQVKKSTKDKECGHLSDYK